jgi:hypothetical protein
MTPDWTAIRLELLQLDQPMRTSLREMRPFFANPCPASPRAISAPPIQARWRACASFISRPVLRRNGMSAAA